MSKFLEFKYRQLLYLPAIPAYEDRGFSFKKHISSGKMANVAWEHQKHLWSALDKKKKEVWKKCF